MRSIRSNEETEDKGTWQNELILVIAVSGLVTLLLQRPGVQKMSQAGHIAKSKPHHPEAHSPREQVEYVGTDDDDNINSRAYMPSVLQRRCFH